MKKVKNIYYEQGISRKETNLSGLILELEDGTLIAGTHEGYVEPFGKITKKRIQELLED